MEERISHANAKGSYWKMPWSLFQQYWPGLKITAKGLRFTTEDALQDQFKESPGLSQFFVVRDILRADNLISPTVKKVLDK